MPNLTKDQQTYLELDLKFRPDSTYYQHLQAGVKPLTPDKKLEFSQWQDSNQKLRDSVNAKPKPWNKTPIPVEILIENRKQHLLGNSNYFMGNTGYTKEGRTSIIGIDIDKVIDCKAIADLVYKSNIGEKAFVSRTRSGNIRVLFYFSPGNNRSYANANNYINLPTFFQ